VNPFPPLESADEDGLLAVGGNYNTELLRIAYQHGIFPWPTGETPMWYSPDPRFVLYPKELVVTKSMRQVLRSGKFRFSINNDFRSVITQCSQTYRNGQQGTWINEKMIEAYIGLYQEGIAHSAETWTDNQLVGGLYGVRVGNVFCGESMFSHVSNASKFAFINMVEHLQKDGVTLIDCQVHTAHLESLGARMIPRKEYISILGK
jgi:leucyl/phenylalanyl-tRNA---protein transferase